MKKFDTILFATDFSEASDYVCTYAIIQAKQFDAKLLVVHVINELEFPIRGIFPDHYVESHIREMSAAADKMMAEFCSKNFNEFQNYETDILTGIPYKKIISKAESEDASLIVVGTHGRIGLEHVLMGSNAEKIVRMAKCPVLSVHPLK